LPFTAVTPLTDSDGKPFQEGAIDPEGLALSSRGTLFVSSEGDSMNQLQPFVNEFSASGQQFRSLDLPDKYLLSADDTEGVRNNLAFESLVTLRHFATPQRVGRRTNL
jgi:hypothetical protein